MIGLFWIGTNGAYLGIPSFAPTSGLALSPAGLQTLGPESRAWAWSELQDVKVIGVPAEPTLGERVESVVSGLLAFALGGTPGLRDMPDMMTVELGTAEGTIEIPVASGTSAYSRQETALSRTLLTRITQGTASPAVMTEWWNETRTSAILPSHERETVLQRWLAAQGTWRRPGSEGAVCGPTTTPPEPE